MENPKLSFASLYSYSLFREESPTELQGSVLLPATDKQSMRQQAPGSLARLHCLLPTPVSKMT